MNGAVIMPYSPRANSDWDLKDILPEIGSAYPATVERVWRKGDGRLMAQFKTADGRVFSAEVWIRRPRA
ncbi:MAG: hypothetical protein KC410_12685 [Anaerolineales bacterium]|uniref:hypothetical protein n=1 Tax=Promineifilum sp. TaxID=2664178 RepID=UPI001E0D7464|nr:hypothetical protein [Anaerolineales bacterium]MCO5182232.1 hypothetical protein [Promineifilum sp.]